MTDLFINLLEQIDNFGLCSGLKINYDKSEIMLMGNLTLFSPDDLKIKGIEVKRSVKILGVHFTYDYHQKMQLNFDEIMKSITAKLKIWKWRNLTIFGRIQIVKTFVVPIFSYRANLTCCKKEVVNQANRIIYDFIWKGTDKVKRLALISDIENGGLKAPHLSSIIETQRILCCKKLASNEPASWKSVLLSYLEPVGGKFILRCNYDVKKLPIKLPKFYEESLKCFAKCSAAVQEKSNRPFATNSHMVQNPPCWRASLLLLPHWDSQTKRPQSVKLDFSLFWMSQCGNNNKLALQYG